MKIIHSPFKETQGVPIQPKAGKDVKGTVEVFPQYAQGLSDLEGFSHIVLIYHFHLSRGFSLEVKPYLDEKLRGVFATRAPSRPNPVGISVVRLLKREKEKLFIQNIDIVDGTPLLDIKPYVPEFDKPEKIKIGWLEKKVKNQAKDDGRFIK
ncbi:MAG: tRNA-Thr(GGU) m(6)t(6)A37 methyltransferase TsaA [candidate division Zixibacteria bacterium SM23_73_2]|nr:MAG: tRNA-Thr(GGU) m(6)t(6)A37 methyltransferase TsaA [candidate division Zixibacteria bacterium SM23_73_2]